MSTFWIPVLVTTLVWWSTTGIVLFLDGRPRRTFGLSMLGATVLLGVALYGIAWSRSDASVFGAYTAFVSGIGVWIWLEMSFLMGFITGPRREGCGLHCSGSRHFVHAIEAILYHELAIIALAAATAALAWQSVNQVGVWTVLTLWALRASAKLNLFFGVRNLSEEFLPEHLKYLRSFFRKRPMNFLFPLSVTAATVVAAVFVQNAMATAATDFAVTGWALLSTLVVLGVIEHWMLVLPFSATALWSWGFQSTTPHRETV